VNVVLVVAYWSSVTSRFAVGAGSGGSGCSRAFGRHFANCAVATALNGAFRLIPCGQVFPTRYTIDFGRTVAATKGDLAFGVPRVTGVVGDGGVTGHLATISRTARWRLRSMVRFA
jgi:hypothetical protein